MPFHLFSNFRFNLVPLCILTAQYHRICTHWHGLPMMAANMECVARGGVTQYYQEMPDCFPKVVYQLPSHQLASMSVDLARILANAWYFLTIKHTEGESSPASALKKT